MLRRWLIAGLLLFAAAVEAREYRISEVPNVQRADYRRYVSNPDGILSEETVVRLDSLCGALRAQGLAQVAVVAVDAVAGGSVFDFAIELFRSWGVGNARNDNGLGILLVKDAREIRFVTGGGLEGVLPDARCKRIQLQHMLPAFRVGDFDAGLTAGLEAVAALLEAGGEAQPESGKPPGWAIVLLFGALLGLPVCAVGLYYLHRHRCPACGRIALKLVDVKVIGSGVRFTTFRYTFRCKKCAHELVRTAQVTHQNIGGPRGPSVRGGRFGGGSFGGGGAGSRW